ncbi:MAG TPA: 5'-methylthioadenosine/S-adenosylhomocysteine nucleosidase [Victivallales bacterium]|nr:5'-methylthioadenosine/S-adenosylhomocysteine nucleosidase [Victivallales bacterium]
MKRKLTIGLILALVVFLLNLTYAQPNPKKTEKSIGIISALRLETAYLKSQIKDPKKVTYLGRVYYVGKIDKKNVVVANVGVGIVNASVGAAILIDKFAPSAIIMTGVAGGTELTKPGDTIIGTAVTFYDLAIITDKGEFVRLKAYQPNSTFSGKGIKRDPLFFKPTESLLSAAVEAAKNIKLDDLEYKGKIYKAKVIKGIFATSETFQSTKSLLVEQKRTNCIATDMEGAGPAQVCYQLKIPFIMIRSVSDTGNLAMYNALKTKAAKNSELLVEKMLKDLSY